MMSRRGVLAATLAAITLLWGFAATASAHSHIDTNLEVRDPATDSEPVEGGVITVCEFYLAAYIDGDDPNGHESGFFQITDANGDVVLDGEWVADVDDPPDRIPDSGSFTLPEGTYNLWWDHEPFVPGGSHREKDFAVVCDEQPTASPNPTGSPAPTATATGSVAPTASASQPGGSVLPTTGATGSVDITLPPTDGGPANGGTRAGDSAAWPIALLLGVVAGFAFLLTPRRARASNPVRNRR
jgi:hypothetical protein